ncbi:MAG: histidinol-phosphate aminotransferase family protein [Chlorobia bacterium]|nr:histidinol-phosphate aminotransferase family protein [Fimbriimonadaceae bacterium]
MSPQCEHGGRFYKVLGPQLESLDQRDHLIPADVLDAWFPPPFSVIEALCEAMPWLARTSPPTHAEPLASALGEYLGVEKECVLPGPGSSSLIFLALTRWLGCGSEVWVPDPGYAEYRHVASLVGAQVTGSNLWIGSGLESIQQALRSGHEFVVIINPNNPTGWRATSKELIEVLSTRAPTTKVWIDEAYAAYVPEVGSLAAWAATQRGVFVCRTLSKSHALSGLRTACLVGHPDELDSLRAFMPPWSVSFPAQVASIQALKELDYYRSMYAETNRIRIGLASFLSKSGFSVLASEANWVLAQHPDAERVISEAERKEIYFRNPRHMSSKAWTGAIRIAVRSPNETERMKLLLSDCCLPQPHVAVR